MAAAEDKAAELLKALTAEKLQFMHEHYEELQFKDKISEELKCSLCEKLAIPNHVPPCQHSICKPCFDLIILSLRCRCPLCNVPMGNVMKSSTRVVIKSLTLDVRCPNTKYGCDTVKTYFELPDHFAECTYIKPQSPMPYDPKYDGDIRDTIRFNSFGTTIKDWILCNVIMKRLSNVIEKTTPFRIDGLPYTAVVKFDFADCTAGMKIVPAKGREDLPVRRILPPYPRVTYTFCNQNENHIEYIFTRTIDLPYGHALSTNGDYHWKISFESVFPYFHHFLPKDNVKVQIKADFPHIFTLDYLLTGHVFWQIKSYQNVLNAQRQSLVGRHCSAYFYTHYDGYKVQAQLIVNGFAFLTVNVLAGENDMRLHFKPRFLFIVKFLDEKTFPDTMTVLDRKAKFTENPIFGVQLDRLKGWNPHIRSLLLDITVKVAVAPYLEFEPKIMTDLSEDEETKWNFDIEQKHFGISVPPRLRPLFFKTHENDVTKLMAEELDFLGRSMARPMCRMPILNVLRQIEDQRLEHKAVEKKELEKDQQKREDEQSEPSSPAKVS